MYIYYFFFSHSLADRHYTCFHVLAIVSNTTISVGVQMFLMCDFIPFRYMPRSKTERSCGSFVFYIIRNLCPVFCTSYTNLQPYQHCSKYFFYTSLVLIFCLLDNWYSQHLSYHQWCWTSTVVACLHCKMSTAYFLIRLFS